MSWKRSGKTIRHCSLSWGWVCVSGCFLVSTSRLYVCFQLLVFILEDIERVSTRGNKYWWWKKWIKSIFWETLRYVMLGYVMFAQSGWIAPSKQTNKPSISWYWYRDALKGFICDLKQIICDDLIAIDYAHVTRRQRQRKTPPWSCKFVYIEICELLGGY